MSSEALIPAFMGIAKTYVNSAETAPASCYITSGPRIPQGSLLVVIRKVACVPRYGTESRELLEVLFSGKKVLLNAEDVHLSSYDAKKLDALRPAQIEANMKAWLHFSLDTRLKDVNGTAEALKATRKYGVAVKDTSIYDVSEYTEGTGFRISIHNPTNKIIKYATVNVVGLNAVGDPVRNPIRGNTTGVLRCIGPIDPGESASYSEDYMWMTDIVEDFRIVSIKVDYMDGTSKTVSNTKLVTIGPLVRQVIETLEDW